MAKTRYYAKFGLINKAYQTDPLGFDLTNWLERSLDTLHIPSFDTCCDAVTDPVPVRYNTEDAVFEFYNATEDEWQTIEDAASTFESIATDTITEATAATGVTIDGLLVKDSGVSANSMFAGFFPTTAAQALSGAGAVNITAYLTKFTSTGAAQALTIASGAQIGQRKKVLHIVDGGSGVLTGVFVGGTTITFTTANEFTDLIWTGSAWGVLELGNYTAAGAAPALA